MTKNFGYEFWLTDLFDSSKGGFFCYRFYFTSFAGGFLL